MDIDVDIDMDIDSEIALSKCWGSSKSVGGSFMRGWGLMQDWFRADLCRKYMIMAVSMGWGFFLRVLVKGPAILCLC